MLLFYPAHHHAEMARFNDHADALWLDGFLNGLGNLRGQPFLDLQAAGEDFDQARNLAQADDFAVRNICDMDFAKERQDVVLAEAEHLDWSEIRRRGGRDEECGRDLRGLGLHQDG